MMTHDEMITGPRMAAQIEAVRWFVTNIRGLGDEPTLLFHELGAPNSLKPVILQRAPNGNEQPQFNVPQGNSGNENSREADVQSSKPGLWKRLGMAREFHDAQNSFGLRGRAPANTFISRARNTVRFVLGRQ
jgi:hypothetical protein